MLLLSPPRDISRDVEEKYLEWADERILKVIRDENPEFYGWLIERSKELIARVVEHRDPR